MFKFAIIAQSSSHMQEAIALHVDVNTPCEQIISKMIQHFNARSKMKAAESRHLVVAFGKRNVLDYLTVSIRDHGYFKEYIQKVLLSVIHVVHIVRHCLEKGRKYPEVVCLACGRMGHKAQDSVTLQTKEGWATVICLRR